MISEHTDRDLRVDTWEARALSSQLEAAIRHTRQLEARFDDSAATELCTGVHNFLDNCREQLRRLETRYARGEVALRPSALELALRHLAESPHHAESAREDEWTPS